MSLTATYVESNEGVWYENPIVKGNGWFICWDDEEPIELVIETRDGLSVQDILSDLANRGWTLEIMYKASTGGKRQFDGKLKQARSYFVKQAKNGPTEQMLAGNSFLPMKPMRDGVYYTNTANGNGGFE